MTPVRHLTLRTPSLDDVFLEYTGNRFSGSQIPEGDGRPGGPDNSKRQRDLVEVGS